MMAAENANQGGAASSSSSMSNRDAKDLREGVALSNTRAYCWGSLLSSVDWSYY